MPKSGVWVEFRYLHSNPCMGNSPAGEKPSQCLNSFSSLHLENGYPKERPSRVMRAPYSFLSSAATQIRVTWQEDVCCVHTPSGVELRRCGHPHLKLVQHWLYLFGPLRAVWQAHAAQVGCTACPTPARKKLYAVNASVLVGGGCIMLILRREGRQSARGKQEFRQICISW